MPVGGLGDTIFALATAQGKAGLAVIRISGENSWAAVQHLSNGEGLPPPREMRLRFLYDHCGQVLDQALIALFEKDKSFTGESSAELHIHGSMAVISSLLEALGTLPKLRLAEPGEFTRRAFENGKLDLAGVEGLSDLIVAETAAQRAHSLRLMRGELGEQVKTWRSLILNARALTEAMIDFADEDLPENMSEAVLEIVNNLEKTLLKEIDGTFTGEKLRTGFEVAIVGRPNVGKSTLINAIAGRNAAITSDIPGTTRDVIEVRADVNGLPVVFLDMAGLRDTHADPIEKIGIKQAYTRAENADLRIFLEEGHPLENVTRQPQDLTVFAKADLGKAKDGLRVSGLTKEGLPELLSAVGEVLKGRVARVGVATNMRHRKALEKAVLALQEAGKSLQETCISPEIPAEHLRRATVALDMLVGTVDVEEILGQIFSEFCIGK